MLLLGLGLGMVMQVLILAVQNAVEYRDLGVATSSATLFRSIGGSLGVAALGALAALPPTLKAGYLQAFTAALHPVFLSATAIAVIGFALTWLLEDLPLRGPARAETVGESFAMPHD